MPRDKASAEHFSMANDKPIPLYTKIGGRLTILLMLLLGLMLIKNCLGSVHYGSITSQEEISLYYDRGYADGISEAEHHSVEEPPIDNPALKKAYQKGFRAGWDAARQQREGRKP